MSHQIMLKCLSCFVIARRRIVSFLRFLEFGRFREKRLTYTLIRYILLASLVVDVCYFLKFLLLALESLDLAVEHLLKLHPFASKLLLLVKVLDRIRAWSWSGIVVIFIFRAFIIGCCGYIRPHYCLFFLLNRLCLFNFRRFLST